MIHLIVGNTGAGKTTYSNALKQKTNGVVFSIDTWNNTLFFADKKADDGVDWILERIERVEQMVMQLVSQLEESGTDSILDLGFSKFEHRQKFRDFAGLHEYKIKLHFLDIPKETRITRVRRRNEEQGDAFEFEVSEDNLEFMEGWFEPPREAELKECIVIKEEQLNQKVSNGLK